MYGEAVYRNQSVRDSMAKVKQRLKEVERLIEGEEYPDLVRDEIRAIWVKPVPVLSQHIPGGAGAYPSQDLFAQQRLAALAPGLGHPRSIFGNLLGGII